MAISATADVVHLLEQSEFPVDPFQEGRLVSVAHYRL